MGLTISSRMRFSALFQSTHPVRGGTAGWQWWHWWGHISIHPPREGWDANRTHIGIEICISIHPPREGWDWRTSESRQSSTKFQSTHPVRGGTTGIWNESLQRIISIHPPREGWDQTSTQVNRFCRVFQSTHPVRGGTPSFPDFPRPLRYFNPPTP